MTLLKLSLIIIIIYYIFPIYLVEGLSMYPTIKHNRLIIASRIFNRNNLSINSLYVYRTPENEKRKVIKRLVDVKKENNNTYCYFLGDNANRSYDSRNYGYVNAENIIAKVIWY